LLYLPPVTGIHHQHHQGCAQVYRVDLGGALIVWQRHAEVLSRVYGKGVGRATCGRRQAARQHLSLHTLFGQTVPHQGFGHGAAAYVAGTHYQYQGWLVGHSIQSVSTSQRGLRLGSGEAASTCGVSICTSSLSESASTTRPYAILLGLEPCVVTEHTGCPTFPSTGAITSNACLRRVTVVVAISSFWPLSHCAVKRSPEGKNMYVPSP